MVKYQLIVSGSLKDSYINILKADVQDGMNSLGLDGSAYLEVLTVEQQGQIDWDGVPVMVWFGGGNTPDPHELSLLDDFLASNAPVFPVVHTLSNYRQCVPSTLHRINGQEWNSAKLAANVLRAFRLSRSQRQAFVSYRRSETRNVAVQLFSELSLQGYKTFLDTASVEVSEDFQEALWGRMADVDLLIFLDSPNALSSHWVHEELARAHDLGLGILQLIWPGHTRTRGTELSHAIKLGISDFLHHKANLDDRLTSAAIAKIIAAAELSRIRSLGARRRRVIADFVDQVRHAQLEVEVHPIDKIEVYRDGEVVGRVIPFVGLPDAPAIQSHEEQIKTDLNKTRIIFDGLGMHQDWEQHLVWLNSNLSLNAIQIARLDDWLETL